MYRAIMRMNSWSGSRNCSKGASSRILGRFYDSANDLRSSVVNSESAAGYGCSERLHSRIFAPARLYGRCSSLVGDSKLFGEVGIVRHVLRRLCSVPERKQHCSNHDDYKATGYDLNRNFLSQLWKKNTSRRKTRRIRQHQGENPAEINPIQPPQSQTLSSSPQEARMELLFARSNFLITRDIEWANLVLGFEQENRYAIVDVCYPKSPAGYIREQSNIVARQFLRTRRPFVAYILDAMGNELFRVRRPFWWITSSIYAEIDGQEIGVVHRRWHLWRRLYDLYLGNRQFAVVENPGLWNWTFTLKDIDGNVLAQIDRDWRGFGFEIFTDAGQYVIRFGRTDPESLADQPHQIQDLDVFRPLTLSERAITVALAVSLDNDYFSRHGGRGLPFFSVED